MPWDIIGWSIIATILVVTAYFSLRIIFRTAATVWLCWRSKDIPLIIGQKWIQDGHPLWIVGSGKRNDGVRYWDVSTGGAQWATTQEEWNERWKNRSLYLVKQP